MRAVASPSRWPHIGRMRLNVFSALALAAVVAAPAGAQSRDVPRTPDGRPDMNGMWQALGNAHWDIEPHAARPALAMREGPVVPVPADEVLAFGAIGAVPSGYGVVEGGAIPYLPEALAKRAENRVNWLDRDPNIKCYLPGVPRAAYMPFPFEIFQSASSFFVAYEYAGAYRDIYYEDRGEVQVDTWMGQSFGRWDGDTFVVEVVGQLADTWFDRAGNHHGPLMKVTERYTMVGPDHIMYEAEIEDNDTFSRPWTIRMPLYRNIDPNARLGQFKCVEFVEELMYGHLRRSPIRR